MKRGPIHRHATRATLLAAVCAVWTGACASVVEDAGPAEPDRAVFDAEVWPMLVRDCGFSECHGSRHRFFRVVGPGHERLDPSLRLAAPVTEQELQFSYDRARSMIDPEDPTRSPLLHKPLEVSAGGASHEGTDNFGLDVYRSTDDPRYQVLLGWVVGLTP